jgi:hypothetical protein
MYFPAFPNGVGKVGEALSMTPARNPKQKKMWQTSANNSSPRPQTAIGPTWAKRGNGNNSIKFDQFLDFLPKWS